MNNIRDTFSEYFDILYKKNSYLDKYGGSVVFTAITLLIFFIVLSYYYIQHRIEPIKRDWVNKRCRPEVMPWAGFINAPKGTSWVNYTSDNFVQCTTRILTAITSHFFKPYYYISDIVSMLMKHILHAINMIRIYFYYLRNKLMKIIEYIIARLVNITIPLQILLIKIKDNLQRASGVAAGVIYTIMGSYLAMKAMLGAFIQIIIICLIILAAFIVAMWILPFTWWVAISATIFFLILATLCVIIWVWLQKILNITGRNTPPKPSCFDKNTIIETLSGNKSIQEITPGTILKNGDKVTAVFKLAYNGCDIYNLDNIIVTGDHKVFDDELGWINTADHPKSIKINNYDEPIIYCLNTASKRITIGKYKFLDWDELEPIDIIKLKNLRYLSKNASLSEIHQNLESGIHGDTCLELDDGHSIKIKDIKLNDQLKFGERVIGLVEIDTCGICNVKKYSWKQFSLIGAPNLHINDTDLGNFNTLHISGNECSKPDKLYHLLTDTNHFSINGIKIRDYNSAIENILDVRDKLFALF